MQLIALLLLGQIAFYAESHAPPQTGTQSYGRAFARARETGQAQPVVFVFGDKHANEVASLLSRVKAANLKVPHIVDLEDCDQSTRAKAIGSISEETGRPFLQTIHKPSQGSYEYGPVWWPIERMRTPAQYADWLQTNNRPLMKSNYRGTNYSNYNTRGYRFRFVPRRVYSGAACAT